MQNVAALAIICDDIRREFDEKFTIVGTITDNLQIPSIPIALSKIGIFARINLPLDVEYDDIELYLIQPNGNEVRMGHFTAANIKEEQEKAKAQQNERVGFISTGVAAPFEIEELGYLKVEMRHANESLLLASVRIALPE